MIMGSVRTLEDVKLGTCFPAEMHVEKLRGNCIFSLCFSFLYDFFLYIWGKGLKTLMTFITVYLYVYQTVFPNRRPCLV